MQLHVSLVCWETVLTIACCNTKKQRFKPHLLHTFCDIFNVAKILG